MDFSQDKKDLISWVATIPWLAALSTAAIDLYNGSEIWTAAMNTIWAVEGLLAEWNSLMNPAFIEPTWMLVWWASAMMLSNWILNKFDYMKDHKKTRYLLNTIAGGLWVAWGATTAPVLATALLAYYWWKKSWKYSKLAMKTLGKTAATPFVWIWGGIAWLAKWWFTWGLSSIKNLWKNDKLMPWTWF